MASSKKSLMNQLQMFDKAVQEAYPSVIKNVRMAIVPILDGNILECLMPLLFFLF